MSTTSNAPKAKSGRSDPKQPKKVVDLQEDEGIIDDEELAERVKAGDLERFDERHRADTTVLMNANLEYRQVHLLSAIDQHLEEAADALMRASLKLRDHVLGDVMFV